MKVKIFTFILFLELTSCTQNNSKTFISANPANQLYYDRIYDSEKNRIYYVKPDPNYDFREIDVLDLDAKKRSKIRVEYVDSLNF